MRGAGQIEMSSVVVFIQSFCDVTRCVHITCISDLKVG